eukprot:8860794-Pyramimonas_sp.AAC.1
MAGTTRPGATTPTNAPTSTRNRMLTGHLPRIAASSTSRWSARWSRPDARRKKPLTRSKRTWLPTLAPKGGARAKERAEAR